MAGEGSFVSKLLRCTNSKKRVLLMIVYIALFLDYMITTALVPLLPSYLNQIRTSDSSSNDSSWTSPAYLKINESNDNDTGSSDISPVSSTPETTLKFNHLEHTTEVGMLLGSKALVQIVANPTVGFLTNRIGFTIPLFAGFVIIFVSTITFALGKSYAILLTARSVQGLGSACCSTAGLGMLAASYTNPTERGTALSIALGGLALGVLAGYPFGGHMYEWAGKEAPFLCLAFVALADGILQIIFLPPKYAREKDKGSSFWTLLLDPYIFLSAVALVVSCATMAMLESALPSWMEDAMNSTASINGLIFIPVTVFYLIGVHTFGPLGHRIGRWILSAAGLCMCGISVTVIPSARNVYGLIAPHIFMGLGIGMFDAAIFPEMGHLVDLRHVGVYGSIYSIADIAVCVAFAIGPFTIGPLIKVAGFPTIMRVIGGIAICYAPLLILLRNPKPRNVPQNQVMNLSSIEKAQSKDTTTESLEEVGERKIAC